MLYTLEEISNITNARVIGDLHATIKNIAFDSRIIYTSKNTAFLAINTEKNSGEKYIKNAIDKGINVIIAETHDESYPNINWIIVDNSIEFLQKLAKHHIDQFNIHTIGITGSNGKTILKEWLSQSLWNEFSIVKSPKSFNSQLGLPLSILKTDINNTLGIFEVGISQPNEMQKLSDIFSPKIGVLTHIGNAHLANFNSEEDLIDEKLKLFKNSEIIVYNGDHPLVKEKVRQLYPEKKCITYGLNDSNNISIISNLENKPDEIEFKIFDEILSIPIQNRDAATLSNVMALITVLKILNIPNDLIIEKINALEAVEMRLEAIEGQNNTIIINDSFNLDLDSLKTALQFVQEYKKDKKSIVITDFFENQLTGNQLYKEVATLISNNIFDNVFLVGNDITKYKDLFTAKTFCYATTDELIKDQTLSSLENQLILLKGSRTFKIDQVKEVLELKKHDTVLEINLNSILHNIDYHKKLLKPTTKMMAMVKANSYGLGSYEISEFLQHHHIDYLGVAFADEGVELRKKGITTPIIVMNPEQHSYKTVIEYNLEPEIYSFRVLKQFNEAVNKYSSETAYPIHIKLETGMHRLGFKTDEIDDLSSEILQSQLKIKSIFSHLSSADDLLEKEFTTQQLELFKLNSEKLIENIGYQPLRHILNSAGITNFNNYQFDMVRIGIGMLGQSSNENVQKQLQSCITFKTVISQISEVKIGESIGYNRKFKAERPSKIATIPVGYADGIPRLIGNKKGKVSIQNKLVDIVGNVCMDMMMIDVTDLKNAKEGDNVTIFNSSPSLQEFASYCNTISYEVLTSISTRVKRIYIKN